MAELKQRGPDGQPILDLGDICDLNEILIVKAENERRAHEHARKSASAKRGHRAGH